MAKLGSVAQISMGVPDLSSSRDFYERLGFKLLGHGDAPWPWAQLTDGQNLVLLNQDGNRYIGLLYMSSETPTLVTELEGTGITFLMKAEHEGQLAQAIFMDENGLMVGLLDQDGSGMSLPNGQPLSKLGKFGEFSVRVKDLPSSLACWSQLGFETLYQAVEPYPWAILGDGLVMLGFHQRTDEDDRDITMHFPLLGPTVTYFALDMADRIASLKAEGIQPVSEMRDAQGQVSGAVLEGPAGERLFLFHGQI
jgi:catechol 2,3-dioxygenase-like lactoylglutathione lyase family enzyme